MLNFYAVEGSLATGESEPVLVATALVLTALLVGTVVSIGQTLRARSELRRALAAEANAQAALQFLQEDVLSQASPGRQPDRELFFEIPFPCRAGSLQ